MDFNSLDIFQIVAQIIVFLFAISVHESAHAWMANRQGDPTAMMLGRITLNPLKHIDPFGTIIFPLIGLISGVGILGWAKPTPVTPENFRNPVRGDILTTVVGPLSNLLLVIIALVVLIGIAMTGELGKAIVQNPRIAIQQSESVLAPIVWLLHTAVFLNVILFIFNLLPVPPLDGSHILRHGLPEDIRRIYDKIGLVGLLVLFIFGGRVIGFFAAPVFNFIYGFLRSL
jgi:Zn-dependent protease